jgi:predicted phosphate transport protein (TIGR00153 family)
MNIPQGGIRKGVNNYNIESYNCRKMAVFTRTTKNLILKIDEFFDNIDLGLLVFREGVKAYLEKDLDAFNRHIQKVELLESNADKLQRSIENEMITHSILPQHRSEVSSLIDVLDEIIDTIKATLNEFSIELPDIPSSLNHNFISIMEASVSAGEELIPAARAYFKSPYTVREKLLKVYYFESETDKVSRSTTRIIFQEMKELDLAHKSHLRYIIHHIENISDNAQKAADLLSAMAIKIVI